MLEADRLMEDVAQGCVGAGLNCFTRVITHISSHLWEPSHDESIYTIKIDK